MVQEQDRYRTGHNRKIISSTAKPDPEYFQNWSPDSAPILDTERSGFDMKRNDKITFASAEKYKIK